MSVYYPQSNCGTSGVIPDYSCSDCPELEFGRVSSFAFIANTFSFTDPTNSAEWDVGIASGDIRVVWQTQGSYDGGTTAENPGFGRQEFSLGSTSHILNFKDPNYKNNCDFYNSIKYSSSYKGAYVTSSQVHLIDSPITIIPKNPVQDDLKSVVTWDVTIKWAGYDSPCPYDKPDGIFEACYVPLT